MTRKCRTPAGRGAKNVENISSAGFVAMAGGRSALAFLLSLLIACTTVPCHGMRVLMKIERPFEQHEGTYELVWSAEIVPPPSPITTQAPESGIAHVPLSFQITTPMPWFGALIICCFCQTHLSSVLARHRMSPKIQSLFCGNARPGLDPHPFHF